MYTSKTEHFFDLLVEIGFIKISNIVSGDQVRAILDPFPVDLVVSERFYLREVLINSVTPIGTRFIPSSLSFGPIIVEANLVLGENSIKGKLGPILVIEGKHRWLDAKEKGEKTIMAWVGDKVKLN